MLQLGPVPQRGNRDLRGKILEEKTGLKGRQESWPEVACSLVRDSVLSARRWDPTLLSLLLPLHPSQPQLLTSLASTLSPSITKHPTFTCAPSPAHRPSSQEHTAFPPPPYRFPLSTLCLS